MNATATFNIDKKYTVDMKELRAMLSLGRNSCEKLGEEAGAVIRIGRRKLYNVKKIQNYLDGISK